jgi:hypothetical protein
MRHIPLSDRERMFGLLQAREAFKQCIRICVYAINSNLGGEQELFLPLAVAAHVIYARPFLHSYGFGKLEDLLVPVQHRPAHQRVLEYRNKVFAHRQLKERRRGAPEAVLDYHAVYVSIRGRQAFTHVAEQHPDTDSFTDIHTLSSALLPKVRYHSAKLFKRHLRLVPKAQGTYKLVMDDGEQPSFTRVDELTFQEDTFSASLPRITPARD